MSDSQNARQDTAGLCLPLNGALIMTQEFNATEELDFIRHQKCIIKKKTYRKSRLSKFQVELVTMKKAGASFSELALWLRRKKRIKVSHTTILRFLAKLTEANQNNA